jgi:hypothetical protein
VHLLVGASPLRQEALRTLHAEQAQDEDTRSGFYVNTNDNNGAKQYVLVRSWPLGSHAASACRTCRRVLVRFCPLGSHAASACRTCRHVLTGRMA